MYVPVCSAKIKLACSTEHLHQSFLLAFLLVNPPPPEFGGMKCVVLHHQPSKERCAHTAHIVPGKKRRTDISAWYTDRLQNQESRLRCTLLSARIEWCVHLAAQYKMPYRSHSHFFLEQGYLYALGLPASGLTHPLSM